MKFLTKRPISSRSFLATLALASLLAAACSTGVHADLNEDIEMAIRTAKIDLAHVGVSVRDGDSGEEIVDYNSDDTFIVASNMKLLSTGAALHVLGPDFSFNTMMRFDGRRLIIVGDGDPAFGDPVLLEQTSFNGQDGLSIDEFVNLWVHAIVDSGITNIDELLVDARIFDDELTHPNWPRKQLNARSFAQVSGFNFHRNLMHFHVRSNDNQKAPPKEILRQPAYKFIDLNNEATSARSRDRSNTGWIARPYRTNNFSLKGNVKTFDDQSVLIRVTSHDAPSLFARLLSDRLRDAGVSVGTSGHVKADDPVASGEIVGPIVSTPLTTVVNHCNQFSQNLYAEALFKRVSRELLNKPGGWSIGSEILRHIVLERVSNPKLINDISISDGSGLSRENLLKPTTLTAWLHSFHVDPTLGPVFIQSLAQPGKPGTLEKRFKNAKLNGAKVYAKSGYVNYVSCLSGYVIAPDGRSCSFSVLVNNLHESGSVGRAKKLQEAIAALIAKDITPANLQAAAETP